MQDLQAQLDAITANTRTLVQPERLAIGEDAIRDLHATGIEQRILAFGAQAPEFTLPDALTGKAVRSADLLALGPLVLTFFRGRWCPYDMTELEAWQQLYPELRARGAMLAAVSPQLPRQNDFTVQRHNLTFPVLSDSGAEVAAQFGLVHTVPPAMQRHYRSILVNIPFINGDESWLIPLPATYVIAPDGKVVFAEAHADHRVRPNPQDVLAAVERCETRTPERQST
jgi:peroxiredoxin